MGKKALWRSSGGRSPGLFSSLLHTLHRLRKSDAVTCPLSTTSDFGAVAWPVFSTKVAGFKLWRSPTSVEPFPKHHSNLLSIPNILSVVCMVQMGTCHLLISHFPFPNRTIRQRTLWMISIGDGTPHFLPNSSSD